MDEIVTKAMAKWPNVPHCFGWLLLDARGAWRMRNEAAQAGNLQGDRIEHAALLAFINRNYARDDGGRWYFQNGPQRVYVNLEATPYIARTDGAGAFFLHTGAAIGSIDAAWFTERGQLLLQSGDQIAQLDDRDLIDCLPKLLLDGAMADDARLLAWIEGAGKQVLTLTHGASKIAIERISSESVAGRFGFVRLPIADVD